MESFFATLKGFLNATLGFGLSDQKGVYSVKKLVKQDTFAAAISYIPFVSPVILLLRKSNSDFVIIHAKQALILSHFTVSAIILAPYLILFMRGFLFIYLLIVIHKSFTDKEQLPQALIAGGLLLVSVIFSDYIVAITIFFLVLYLTFSVYRALKGKRIYIPVFTEIASVFDI
ncbi:hypothetical protein IID22_05245 [Patescibacteria group bacterium]|nr:hypothetical protein [Patescibacteria group bacterium]